MESIKMAVQARIVKKNNINHAYYVIQRILDKIVMICDTKILFFELDSPMDFLVDHICWRVLNTVPDPNDIHVTTTFDMSIEDFDASADNHKAKLTQILRFVRYAQMQKNGTS